jgi:hypothetical protein
MRDLGKFLPLLFFIFVAVSMVRNALRVAKRINQQPPSPLVPPESADPEVAERTRRIQEMIRRKIAERRGEPVAAEAAPVGPEMEPPPLVEEPRAEPLFDVTTVAVLERQQRLADQMRALEAARMSEQRRATQVTADLKNGEYVINGRKYWPSSAAGWDMKGADVNTVLVRTDRTKGGKGGLSAILVPRGTPGVTYEPVIDKMGQRLNQNCDIRFNDARVPEENVFAVGNGDLIISKDFTWSGPVAGIAAVGTARAAYEYTLNWCKTYTAGGTHPIIYHQNVGYMLTDIAMRIEACRYLCYKSGYYADLHDCENQALGAMAKIYPGEVGLQIVYDCMRVMGVNSYDRRSHPLEKYLRDMLCFPIYDAGNMGMQRRKIWGVMADKNFNPRAFMDNEAIEFTKNMEGIGVVATPPAG